MSNTALKSICGRTQTTHRHWAKAFAASPLHSNAHRRYRLIVTSSPALHNAFLMEHLSFKKKYECQHSPCFHRNDKGSFYCIVRLNGEPTFESLSRSNSLPTPSFRSLPPFLHPLVPIQLRLNYGPLNKAATNALPCSPLLTFPPFLSYWSSAWKELAELLCPRHQLAATRAPLNNTDVSRTLGKLALLVDHTHTHAQHWLPCMYYQWRWPI